MVPRDRVELPTHGASIHCSTNWAIEALFNFYIKKWRSRRESNPRSPAWQAGVITATPRDLVLKIAGDGFEPSTFGLWAQRAARLLHPAIIKMEEERGFEPLRAFTLLSVFKTDPFSRTWVFLLDKWWTLQDSNLRPIGYEPIALTNWAKSPCSCEFTNYYWWRQRGSNPRPYGYEPYALASWATPPIKA